MYPINGSISPVAIFCLLGSDVEGAGGKCIFGNINSFYFFILRTVYLNFLLAGELCFGREGEQINSFTNKK